MSVHHGAMPMGEISTCPMSSDRISSLPQDIGAGILSGLGGIFGPLCHKFFCVTAPLVLGTKVTMMYSVGGCTCFQGRNQVTLQSSWHLDRGIRFHQAFSSTTIWCICASKTALSAPLRKLKAAGGLTFLYLKLFSSTDSDINNVEGNFEDLHLHAPNLVHAYLTLDKSEAQQYVPIQGDRKSYLKQAFGGLTHIKTLTVSSTFLMYLSKGCMVTKLPGVFSHLEKICIEGRLWNWTENYARAEDLTPKRMWEEDYTEIQAPALVHLVTVTLHDFMGYDCEISLLGLLLNWAPALEELKIEVPKRMKDHCICKIMKRLLTLPRASSKAKVMFT
ncbi:unnamed protein product [Urochloa humidicola]